jgi:hypothetical protein
MNRFLIAIGMFDVNNWSGNRCLGNKNICILREDGEINRRITHGKV